MTGPQPSDPGFAGHFAGLREGALRFPYCAACARFHWYPMPRCPHCRAPSWSWRAVAGRAELYSWTVVRHPFDPAFAAELPYVVALVTFADAPEVRLVTNLVGVEAARIAIGMAVDPVFDRAGSRVQFRAAN